MHERRAIREAVISLLNGNTSAGARIDKARIAPNPQAQLPAISVYGSDEATDPESRDTAPRELKRTVQIIVDGWVVVTPSSSLDDTLDDGLCLEIETALDQDRSLAGSASDIVLVSTEIGQDLSGSRPMGVAHMTFEVTYYTTQRNRATIAALDDFTKADVKFTRVNGADTINPANQVEDLKTDIHE